MIVHLVDYDSKIPNLALMRVSSYHKSLGDEVRYSKGKKASIALDVDKIYISCIYKKNKKHVNTFIDSLNNEYSDSPVEIDVGGSGYDLKKVLSDEIESMKPDYSLYPDCDSSYGFSSRGCPRVCSFCIVRSNLTCHINFIFLIIPHFYPFSPKS